MKKLKLSILALGIISIGIALLYFNSNNISGVNAENEEVEYSKSQFNNIKDKFQSKSDDTKKIPMIAEYAIDFSSMKQLNNEVENIALIKINSVDYNNYNYVDNTYTIPYTYGEAEIIKPLKGKIKPGQKIDYFRFGGKITYEQWKASLNERQLSRLIEDENKPEYYEYIFTDGENSDISIEKDLIYLAYFEHDEIINTKGQYSLVGLQYGLRQALITKSKNGDEVILVKDNDTNKWTNIQKITSEK